MTFFKFFVRAKETNIDIWNKIEETTFGDIDLFYFSSFIFQKNHGFIEEGKPSEKVVIAEGKLHGTNIDELGNLEYFLRFVLINDECGNLK